MDIWKSEDPIAFQNALNSLSVNGAERHTTIKEEFLVEWEKQLTNHFSGTSYEEICRRDIKIARSCNVHDSELIILRG